MVTVNVGIFLHGLDLSASSTACPGLLVVLLIDSLSLSLFDRGVEEV